VIVSEFRFEKERVQATLWLAPGTSVDGAFFVAGRTSTGLGRERVGDLLNAEPGFFPFELHDGRTVLYSRAQLVAAAIEPAGSEATEDSGYDVATKCHVGMVLSTGLKVTGTIAMHCPPGRTRISDYARLPQAFRYVVTSSNTLLINTAHIVEIMEVEG
jgi:hypothetical protein